MRRPTMLIGALLALTASLPTQAANEFVTGEATYMCNADPSRGRPADCHYRYPDRRGDDLYAAAGPALRAMFGGGERWRNKVVTVIGNNRDVTVKLIDSCDCGGGRVIDLYADAFERLAPLTRGVVSVLVRSRGQVPSSTLPPTDTSSPVVWPFCLT